MSIDHGLEQRLTESAPMLRRLRDDLKALRQSGDREELRRRLEGVISRISVRKGEDGKPEYSLSYRFMPEAVRASDGRQSKSVTLANDSTTPVTVEVTLTSIRRTRRRAA